MEIHNRDPDINTKHKELKEKYGNQKHQPVQSFAQVFQKALAKDVFDHDTNTVSPYDDASNMNGGKNPYCVTGGGDDSSDGINDKGLKKCVEK